MALINMAVYGAITLMVTSFTDNDMSLDGRLTVVFLSMILGVLVSIGRNLEMML